MPESARPALRFLTCGSVDDGKSTLIGRLLYEQGAIPDDQMAVLERDSRRHGTVGGNVDFALLVDGLEAEREQGITIDVAYRYFATPKRAFVVADAPGHEQYTRNMATAASNAEFAVLLVDATKGLLPQTHRHAVIASMFGIRHVALAVNKIDLVSAARPIFEAIVAQFRDFSRELEFRNITPIPLSALHGDNVSRLSERTSWYKGPTLLEALESADAEEHSSGGARLQIQWVNRADAAARGYSGTLTGGVPLRVGDVVAAAGSEGKSVVARILTAAGEAEYAAAGDAVTITLSDEIDLGRGDLLCAADAPPHFADQFAAHLMWMGREALHPGRSYFLKIGGLTTRATVTRLKHKLDIGTLAKLAADHLEMNEIGLCNLATTSPIAFDSYATNRDTGGFILIDREDNTTLAAGLMRLPLHRAANVHPQNLTVTKAARASLKGQRPVVLWFTGLSGAGKSTIADLVERELHARGRHTVQLDGDNLRQGLNRDLGFTEDDRIENVRRAAEVAKLMTEAGLITLCALISPFAAERRMARELFAEGEFIEIYVRADLATVVARDPKGLYKRALAGAIPNFTGIQQPYEPPDRPELLLDTDHDDPKALAARVIEELEQRGALTTSL